MKRTRANLTTWLRLSLATFLGLIAINLGLSALFLLLQIPSFAIGNDALWILRWKNDATGSGIQFNLLLLFIIAIAVGLIAVLIKNKTKDAKETLKQ